MTLSELIERVEGLEGSSREVDAAIAAHFHLKQITNQWPDWCVDPPFTASLDAAVALCERVLPGFGISIETHPVYGDWWDAAIFDRMPKTVSNARKQTAALALCLALLRAALQKEPQP